MATQVVLYFCQAEKHLGRVSLDPRFPTKFECEACNKKLHADLEKLEFKGATAKTHNIRQVKEMGVEK